VEPHVTPVPQVAAHVAAHVAAQVGAHVDEQVAVHVGLVPHVAAHVLAHVTRHVEPHVAAQVGFVPHVAAHVVAHVGAQVGVHVAAQVGTQVEPNVGSDRLVTSVADEDSEASTSITSGAGGRAYPPRGTLRLASAASTDWANSGESADASVLMPLACTPDIHKTAVAIRIRRITGMRLSSRLLMVSLNLPSQLNQVELQVVYGSDGLIRDS